MGVEHDGAVKLDVHDAKQEHRVVGKGEGLVREEGNRYPSGSCTLAMTSSMKRK